jgi:hypothetical protein
MTEIEETEIRYPRVEVELLGKDGNAWALPGRVRLELQRAGVSKDEIDEFFAEATSGGYDQLLATVTKWVTVT